MGAGASVDVSNVSSGRSLPAGGTEHDVAHGAGAAAQVVQGSRTTGRLRALDLFCCAGGAAMGLHRADFDVTGIDIRPQPRYPFRFIQADALRPPVRLEDFDLIWASPPCQHASVGSRRWIAAGRSYPALIEPTREMLLASGVPFIIENVPGAAIRADLVLTGEMFGLKTHRRRHFELGGWWTPGPAMSRRLGPKTAPGWCTIAGHGGDGPNNLCAWSDAMGIDWMTKGELAEAIPPAYSEFIARAFLAQLPARLVA